MYKKVLVPLDGSTLAESVLPHVGSIAECCQSEITFLRVVEPAIYSDSTHILEWQALDRINEENRKAADQYLTELLARVHYNSGEVHKVVITGKPTDTITNYARQNDTDLIILTTHGHSGVSRLVWGSVTDHILRMVGIPILVIRPTGFTRESG